MVLGAAIGLAALGTCVLSLAGRWIGGAWTTLLAILVAMLLAYHPLIGASLTDNFKTDLLRRIVLASIPFTIVLAGLSFKKVPEKARAAFAVFWPALMLWFVFANYPITFSDLFLHRIGPVCLAIFGCWLLIEPIAVRSPGSAVTMVIGFLTGTGAFALIDSTQQQAGAIAPIIPATAAGALAAVIIGSFFKLKLSFAGGPVLLWLTLLGALFAFLWIDGTLPVQHLYWMATIPVVAWVCEIPWLHRLKPWKRESLRFVLMAIPAVIVSVQMYREMQQNLESM